LALAFWDVTAFIAADPQWAGPMFPLWHEHSNSTGGFNMAWPTAEFKLNVAYIWYHPSLRLKNRNIR
jgi:hypothetical protein